MSRFAVVLLACVLPLAAGQVARGGERASFDVGGGLLMGGYLGDLQDNWSPGMGGSLFIQVPWCCDTEGRLRASMLWNDGATRGGVVGDGPDLGALEGDTPRSFRRTSYEATLLWRAECCPIGDAGVPYLGAGIAAYERDIVYDNPSGRNEVGAWSWGGHGVAGLRLYRTSGLFVALEGTLHAFDTPKKWTVGYDAALLVGVRLAP
ncbi:MAG: hypothetical protein FJY88_09335 [Candidatus Eisenbacteria bacterium]|nr:hypothetical protein [Candidatus Eisenbacteria bacterium]